MSHPGLLVSAVTVAVSAVLTGALVSLLPDVMAADSWSDAWVNVLRVPSWLALAAAFVAFEFHHRRKQAATVQGSAADTPGKHTAAAGAGSSDMDASSSSCKNNNNNDTCADAASGCCGGGAESAGGCCQDSGESEGGGCCGGGGGGGASSASLISNRGIRPPARQPAAPTATAAAAADDDDSQPRGELAELEDVSLRVLYASTTGNAKVWIRGGVAKATKMLTNKPLAMSTDHVGDHSAWLASWRSRPRPRE